MKNVIPIKRARRLTEKGRRASKELATLLENVASSESARDQSKKGTAPQIGSVTARIAMKQLKVVESGTYVLEPTASKVDLLFACTYPWGRAVRRGPVGERTRFGSAFHEALEKLLNGEEVYRPTIAEKWSINEPELADRLSEAQPVLVKWLAGGNQWGVNFTSDLQTEVSVAVNPTTGKTRFLPNGPGEHHDYPDKLPGEIPGTADIVSVMVKDGKKYLLVEDHKSGWNFAADWQAQTPAELGQLLTLALALAKLYGLGPNDVIVLAIFHAPHLRLPLVLADEVTIRDLEKHRLALKAAMSNIGNGWLRPGQWCGFCPAFDECPTQRSALVDLKRTPGGLMTAERVGAIHQALSLYEKLSERLRDEIRAWVRVNGPAERPDGAIVNLVERETTSLSQSSIKRALGPLKGGEEIERLRRLGCIETSKRHELRAKK